MGWISCSRNSNGYRFLWLRLLLLYTDSLCLFLQVAVNGCNNKGFSGQWFLGQSWYPSLDILLGQIGNMCRYWKCVELLKNPALQLVPAAWDISWNQYGIPCLPWSGVYSCPVFSVPEEFLHWCMQIRSRHQLNIQSFLPAYSRTL